MTWRERWQRWNTRRKLRRGRCRLCDRILPDDVYDTCDDCYDPW